jgi:hypothetical protein
MKRPEPSLLFHNHSHNHNHKHNHNNNNNHYYGKNWVTGCFHLWVAEQNDPNDPNDPKSIQNDPNNPNNPIAKDPGEAAKDIANIFKA